MSYIAIYHQIVKSNNGTFNNNTNKCGTISLGHSTGIHWDNYVELINEVLCLEQHEKLDIQSKSHKLQEICDLLGFSINVHCGRYLDKGLIRIWKSKQIEFVSKDQPKSHDIHILWFGDHFEYINWNELLDYPEYKENVYKFVSEEKPNSAEEFMTKYHLYNQIM